MFEVILNDIIKAIRKQKQAKGMIVPVEEESGADGPEHTNLTSSLDICN